MTVLATPDITDGPLLDLTAWDVTVRGVGVFNPLSIQLVGSNVRLVHFIWGIGSNVTNVKYLGGPPFWTNDQLGTLQPFNVPEPYP